MDEGVRSSRQEIGPRHEIVPGTIVYGRLGWYLGRVEAAGAQTIRIRGRGPLSPVFYVPRRLVLGVLPGGELFIDATRAGIEDMGWQRPPTPPGYSADD